MDIRDLINKLDDINEGEFDQYSGDQASARAAVASKQEFAAKQKELYALLQKLRTLVNPVNESKTNIAKPLIESFGYEYNDEILMEGFWSNFLTRFNSDSFAKFRKFGFRITIVYDAYRVYQKIKSLPDDMPITQKAEEVKNMLYPLVKEQGLFFIGASLAAFILSPISATGAGAFVSGLLSLLAGGWASMKFGDDIDKFCDWVVKQLFGDIPSDEPASAEPTSTTEPTTTTGATTTEPTTTTGTTTTEPTTTTGATTPSSTVQPEPSPAAGQGSKPTDPAKATSNPEVKSVVDQIKSLIADLQQSSDTDAPKAVNHAKQTLQIYAPGL